MKRSLVLAVVVVFCLTVLVLAGVQANRRNGVSCLSKLVWIGDKAVCEDEGDLKLFGYSYPIELHETSAGITVDGDMIMISLKNPCRVAYVYPSGKVEMVGVSGCLN